MKKHIVRPAVIGALLLFATAAGFGQQQKLAQTGFKFLSVTTDARAGAMGEAFTSLQSASSAMFFNPAGMARLDGLANVSFGLVQWIADIDYSYGSAAFRPFDGAFGVIGVSVVSVDYGNFMGTIRDPGKEGFVDTGNFSPTAFSVGLGYAKAITDKFAVGGNIKYVKQDLGSGIVGFQADGAQTKANFSADVMAFDFGILYHTGFKSLDFGVAVRNFSKELKFLEEGFQLPLTFKMGVSIDAMDFLAEAQRPHNLLVSVDAVHPRDYSEQLNFGGEYLFRKTVALRAGYSFPNDEHGFSAGAGLQQALGNYKFALDYAYTPFGIFDSVNRVTVQFAF
jgi:hypothetical protein